MFITGTINRDSDEASSLSLIARGDNFHMSCTSGRDRVKMLVNSQNEYFALIKGHNEIFTDSAQCN